MTLTLDTVDVSPTAPVQPAAAGHCYIERTTFEGTSYSVRPPPAFQIVVEHGDGYTIIREANTGIFGSAPDIAEAFRDLRQAIAEHLDVLQRQPALSDELQWQLKYMQARVWRN
jgi:hypothetical protein